MSTKAIKLPKNFAELVLNEELKIDAGQVDLESVNRLLQMYSVSRFFHLCLTLFQRAVEYYSGMNDEKYMYFTERIQNTLLKPEILEVMREGKMKEPEQNSEGQASSASE